MKPNNYLGESISDSEKDRSLYPSLLKYIESQHIEDALKNRPGILAELCRQISAAGPLEPEIYHRFMRYYWEGVGLLVIKSPPVNDVLAKTMPLTVNLEATDTSLLGHFRIRGGKIHGGPGMTAFRDQDFRFFGPTRVLMMLLNDELPLGYSDLNLHSEGHPGIGGILFPVMKIIAQLTKGAESSTSSAT